jgi:hypothetical protein
MRPICFLKLLVACCSLFSLHAAPPPQIPIETLFSEVDMTSVFISPTGRYLTWLAPKNQRINLAILDRETNKLRWLTDMKEESVTAYQWVKKDRILFAQQWAGREEYGMFACNPDGSNLIIINKLQRVEADADGAGQAAPPSSELDLPKSLVSTLPKDPDHILICLLYTSPSPRD